MPAGTDLITWSPRVGSTGDDRYDPGEVPLVDGSSSFSGAYPTMAEVNASSGLNQIILELKRRFMGPSCVTDGARHVASLLATMKSNADDVRGLYELPAYSWTASYVAGNRSVRLQIADLRKALAVDHIRAVVSVAWEHPNDSLRAAGTSWPPGTISFQSGYAVGRYRSSGTRRIWRRYFNAGFREDVSALEGSVEFDFAGHALNGSWNMALCVLDSYPDALDLTDWDIGATQVDVQAATSGVMSFDIEAGDFPSDNNVGISLVNENEGSDPSDPTNETMEDAAMGDGVAKLYTT